MRRFGYSLVHNQFSTLSASLNVWLFLHTAMLQGLQPGCGTPSNEVSLDCYTPTNEVTLDCYTPSNEVTLDCYTPTNEVTLDCCTPSNEVDDDDDCFYIALFSTLEQTHCTCM